MSIREEFTRTLNIVLVAAGVFFIGSQAFTQGPPPGVGPPPGGGQPSAPVTVSNTPLPTTVTNTPLPTTVTNTVATSIAASTTLPVQIINPVNAPSTVNVGNPVQNRDEPGRNPYQHTVRFNPNSSICPNTFYCAAAFPAVPAGKRLVVTYASAQYRLTMPGGDPDVSVGKNSDVFSDAQFIPTVQGSPGYFLAAGPVTFYVEAGEVPTVFLAGTNIDTCCTQTASISGYLISLP
jgi:hypothetical protein